MAANFLTLRPLGRTPSGSQHNPIDDRRWPSDSEGGRAKEEVEELGVGKVK
jgi:hypothetical protein